MDGAEASDLYFTVYIYYFIFILLYTQVGGRDACEEVLIVRLDETGISADLGGSSNYSNENFEDCVEKGSM